MDRMPSDNLDNLLLALAKLEYRDFVGVNLELAKVLIKLFNKMNAMLDLEINSRTFNAFMPIKKQPHRSSDGAWPA